MRTFQPGTTVTARSICDYECIFTCDIIARTPKTATVLVMGKEKRCKISQDSESEYMLPMGRYSMAPIFRP